MTPHYFKINPAKNYYVNSQKRGYQTYNSVKLAISSKLSIGRNTFPTCRTFMIAFSDTFLDAYATETMIAVRIEMRICTVLKADRAFKFFTDKALKRL